MLAGESDELELEELKEGDVLIVRDELVPCKEDMMEVFG